MSVGRALYYCVTGACGISIFHCCCLGIKYHNCQVTFQFESERKFTTFQLPTTLCHCTTFRDIKFFFFVAIKFDTIFIHFIQTFLTMQFLLHALINLNYCRTSTIQCLIENFFINIYYFGIKIWSKRFWSNKINFMNRG